MEAQSTEVVPRYLQTLVSELAAGGALAKSSGQDYGVLQWRPREQHDAHKEETTPRQRKDRRGEAMEEDKEEKEAARTVNVGAEGD